MKTKNNLINTVKIVALVLGVVLLSGILIYDHISEKNRQEYLQEMSALTNKERREAEEACMITLSYDESVDLLEGIEANEVVNHEAIVSKAKLTTGYLNNAAVSFDLSDFAQKDISKYYMVVFEIYTEEKSAVIDVQIDSVSSVYYITKEPSAFYLPVSKFDDFKITLKTDFQNTHVGNLSIIETNGLSSGVKHGQYGINSIESYSGKLLNENVGREVLYDDENGYVYLLSKRSMISGKLKNGVFEEVGQIDSLGSVVHGKFINDSMIVVTSRENDVYFVDISNPADMKIVSEYDGFDLATGVEVCDDYLFVCSRYFGVEIVDISDLTNPHLVSMISTGGECIECVYDSGYLYISNWNLKQVWIYDVTDSNTPKKVNVINNDGNTYGVTVKDNLLFVATGHNSANKSTEISDAGYGGGHGMEIYDVSDPKNVVWKSTVKIDGRLLHRAIDSWGVYVNGNYAFLASTYAGVYVYDVTDAESPTRVGKISTKIEAGTKQYSYTDSSTSVFPYDVTKYIEDPITSVAFGENKVYLAGNSTGLYELDWNGVTAEKSENKDSLAKFDGSWFDNMKETSVRNSVLYSNHYSVNACDASDEYVYIACGIGGVEILDKKGTKVSFVKTAGSAQDIVVKGDYVYVAEGNYGIEVFKTNGHKLELISSYRCTLVSETITHIILSNNTLIAQDGWTRVKILDVSNPYNVTSVKDFVTGTMYLKNLVKSSDGGNVIGFGSSREVKLFDTSSGLKEIGSVTNDVYGERDGICEYKGNLIAIKGNGYVVFSSDDVKNGTKLSSLKVNSCGDNYKLKGKVTCYDSNMVVTDAVGKNVAIVDISNLKNPQIISYFSVQGNPMIAKITDEYFYIPLSYQGLLIIPR